MGNCRNCSKKQMEVGRGRVRFFSPRSSCWTYATKLEGTLMGVWERDRLPNPGHGGCGEVVKGGSRAYFEALS